MVLRIKSKNHALNVAAGGFANAVPGGIALGQRSRALDEDERNGAVRRDLALREARQADEQLRMRQASFQANAQAAGEMATPEQPDQTPDEHDASIQRVKAIAQEMARTGSPMSHVASFVQDSAEKHKKLVDDRERKGVLTEISKLQSDGSLFTTQPDGTLMESEAINDGLKKIADLEAKGAPTDAIKQEWENVKRAKLTDESRLKRRAHVSEYLAGLKAQIGAEAPPPTDMNQAQALIQQKNTLGTAEEIWKLYGDKIEADPKLLTQFMQQASDAAQGFTMVGGKRVPIGYAQMEAENQKALNDARVQAQMAQAELARMKAAQIPQETANDTTRAQADMIDAGRGRGPASGTVEKEPSYGDMYLKARATVMSGKGAEKLTAEQVNAETNKEMGRMRSAIRGFKQMDEPAAPEGAPTKEAQAAAGADAATHLASPQLREADVRANPAKYRGKFASKADLDRWIAQGGELR